MSDRDDENHLKDPIPPAQLSLHREPGWALKARGSSPVPPVKGGSITSDHLYGSDVSGVWPQDHWDS